MKLNELSINKEGKIKYIKQSNIKRRLMDMGLNKNIIIKPVLINKNIKAYSVKNTIIALRDKDAKNIEVEI